MCQKRPSYGSVLRRRLWMRWLAPRSEIAELLHSHWCHVETGRALSSHCVNCSLSHSSCLVGEWTICRCDRSLLVERHNGVSCAATFWTELPGRSRQSPSPHELPGPAKWCQIRTFPSHLLLLNIQFQKQGPSRGVTTIKKRILTMMKMFLLHNWWCGDEYRFSE